MTLGAGGGVEADRSGGGQVQALGPPVDRDRDPVVREHSHLVGQSPRLVAEQPGGGSGEEPVVDRVVEGELAGAVGGQHLETTPLEKVDG
jgi:hypothetical protein